VRTRLLAKVRRAYRNAAFPPGWSRRSYKVWQRNASDLPIADGGVDAIVSSPPYFGALDYARDNRLRLWFLGCQDWKRLDSELTASEKVYLPQMTECLREMNRVLKIGGYCVLVLGDVERDGKLRRTAEILSDLAALVTGGHLRTEEIHDDVIPDDRRSRRKTRTTKYERILVMRKMR
jgi:tRNA G10  N-methylase Trm11